MIDIIKNTKKRGLSEAQCKEYAEQDTKKRGI